MMNKQELGFYIPMIYTCVVSCMLCYDIIKINKHMKFINLQLIDTRSRIFEIEDRLDTFVPEKL